MAERPSLSSIKPFEAKPEALSAPSTVDGAEAGETPPGKTAGSTEATAESAENVTFANTRQHVADRQKTPVTIERFTNTKQNIALINDPKTGPQFTLTKKESGHVERSVDKPVAPVTDKAKPGPDPALETEADTTLVPEEKTLDCTSTPETRTAGSGSAAINESEDGDKQKVDTPSAQQRPVGPLGVPPSTEPPGKVPVDSSKTFVGTNGTYYDEAWRWMDWRGVKQSWNWSAALSFGHWFAYRRLYRYAGAFVIWLMSLAAALVNNVHVGLVAGLLVFSLGLVGLYANTLYFQVFRRAVAHVTEEGEGSYDDLRQQLAEAGGVNPKAPWSMAASAVIGVGLALVATFFAHGGLSINIWPL